MNNAASSAPEILLFSLSAISSLMALKFGVFLTGTAVALALAGQILRTIRTTPRTLPDKIKKRLSAALEEAMIPQNIVVEDEGDEFEGREFAINIRLAFEMAGLNVQMQFESLRNKLDYRFL